MTRAAWSRLRIATGATSLRLSGAQQPRSVLGKRLLEVNNYTFNYTYNLGGQLTQANYVAPSFNKNVIYTCNANGALSGIGTKRSVVNERDD